MQPQLRLVFLKIKTEQIHEEIKIKLSRTPAHLPMVLHDVSFDGWLGTLTS